MLVVEHRDVDDLLPPLPIVRFAPPLKVAA